MANFDPERVLKPVEQPASCSECCSQSFSFCTHYRTSAINLKADYKGLKQDTYNTTDSEHEIRGALVVLKIFKIWFITANIFPLELIASLQMPSEVIPNSAWS